MHFETSRLSKAAKAYVQQETAKWQDLRERGSGIGSDEDELDRDCSRWLEIGNGLLLDGKPIDIDSVRSRLLAMADRADALAKSGLTTVSYHPGEVELNREMIRQVIARLSDVSLRLVTVVKDDAAIEAARAAAVKENERRFMLKRLLGS